jgi:hypothetical protein
MYPGNFDPLAFWRLSMEIGQMTMEAHHIMTHRVLGMAGILPMRSDEPARMITEKHDAMTASGLAVGQAMMAGKSATDVMAAAVKPMRAKTKANAKRLSKPGRKT